MATPFEEIEEKLLGDSSLKKKVRQDGSLSDKEKKTLILCVLVTNFVCGTQYLNIASFFPNFVKSSYPGTITETMTAFCLTSN